MLDGEPVGVEGPGGLRALRAEAARRLARVVEEESARTGLVPDAVAVREMRTRWGTCNARRRVGLNWRLAMAPGRVQRYVVVHELCHLEALDHSRRFWGLVERHWPGYREDQAWLKEHGWLLAALPWPPA